MNPMHRAMLQAFQRAMQTHRSMQCTDVTDGRTDGRPLTPGPSLTFLNAHEHGTESAAGVGHG